MTGVKHDSAWVQGCPLTVYQLILLNEYQEIDRESSKAEKCSCIIPIYIEHNVPTRVTLSGCEGLAEIANLTQSCSQSELHAASSTQDLAQVQRATRIALCSSICCESDNQRFNSAVLEDQRNKVCTCSAAVQQMRTRPAQSRSLSFNADCKTHTNTL